MMSIAAMGVGTEAADYCIGSTREDYYNSGGDPLGVWHGVGLAALGLAGKVDQAAFRAVLQGRHPVTDSLMTGTGSGAKAHRAGWDCTFSAPKSVSVLWGLSDQQVRLAVETAHETAVQAALAYLESHAAFTRRGHGGTEQELVKGLVTATFKHFTSRAGDPQLHTHCIVMNLAPREDGSFGTLDSKHLYDHKMAAGAVYRMALGTELAVQGYSLTAAKHGFEVAGVDETLCKNFSKRREQIVSALKEHGGKSAAASQIATLGTRQEKHEANLAERFEHWRTEASELAPTLPTPSATNRATTAIGPAELVTLLTRDHSTFSRKDMIRVVATAGVGTMSYPQLLRTVDTMVSQGSVIRLPKSLAHDPRFTTSEMLDIEQRCLETAAAMAAQRTNLVATSVVDGVEQRSKLTDGIALSAEQRAAVRHIASDTGRIALIEGLAGTGKTQMLKTVRQIYEAEGMGLRGCSLSGKAAQNLQEGSGIQSETLHRVLHRLDQKQLTLTPRDVVVLDEAGMVGSRQMNALVQHVAQAGAKLVLVGDSKQLQPIDAGQMFGTLASKLGKSDLTEIRRQNQTWARDAVRAVIVGQTSDALRLFAEHGQLSHCRDQAACVELLAQDWMADPLPLQKKLILSGTRLEAFRLNQVVRQSLKNTSAISGPEISFETSQGAIRKLAAGDRVVFLRNDLGLAVKNGTLGIVTSCLNPGPRGMVTVRLDDGKVIKVPLAEYNHLDHGYALTVHKAQGTTIDGNVYVMTSEAMTDREWSYVALSRAKLHTRIYTNGMDDTQLQRDMQRSHRKDTSMDHVSDQEKEL